jgi:hypothetical protein
VRRSMEEKHPRVCAQQLLEFRLDRFFLDPFAFDRRCLDRHLATRCASLHFEEQYSESDLLRTKISLHRGHTPSRSLPANMGIAKAYIAISRVVHQMAGRNIPLFHQRTRCASRNARETSSATTV